MSAATLLVAAVLATAPGLAPQASQDSVRLGEREALRAVEARMRAARPGTAAMDSARVTHDSIIAVIVAGERARVDSLRQAVRDAAAAAGPPPRNPLHGDGPFYGYTWVFWADLVVGAALSWFVAARFGRRYGGLRTLAATLWAIIGALMGAVVFGVAFIANGMWSIGFSAMPPAFFFLVTLMGMVAGLAAVADVTLRRRRR